MLETITISGSYRKFPEELRNAINKFRDLLGKDGVLSPKSAIITSAIEGFVSLRGDIVPRINDLPESKIGSAMKAVEDGHLQAIQQSDALWAVIPECYCGNATTFEIGWALAHQVPVFYESRQTKHVKEPIIKCYAIPVISAEYLVKNFETMPRVEPEVSRYLSRMITAKILRRQDSGAYNKNSPDREFLELKTSGLKSGVLHPPVFNNSCVAVGPLIVDNTGKYRTRKRREILLVKTGKWGGRFSIVGSKIRIGEKLNEAFFRTVREQTGLEGMLGEDICSFDEIQDSCGERNRRLFVDKVVKVESKKVNLDHRAEDYLWISPRDALKELDIEPNARRTIEMYIGA